MVTDAKFVSDAEVPLGFDELFYSRTDARGVILAGNHVFKRVAQYDWDELLGAPHKIVRHPDTPKGVFRLLWDALGKGLPMGAYVKNRAKSGGYYWVFAVIIPLDGGYLSVRLKPSSPLFAKMAAVYPELAETERQTKADPEGTVEKLRDIAIGEGFSTLTSYMAYALGQELTARDVILKRPSDRRTVVLSQMNSVLEAAASEQKGLLRSFEALQAIPNNMRIVASRLEPSGGPVSSISENYKVSSAGISDRLRSFVVGRDNMYDQMAREVARALFLLGCSRVIAEMAVTFEGHDEVMGIDWGEEKQVLDRALISSADAARSALRVAADLAAGMTRSSREIRRQMLGLDTIRVLGRVECGRMRGAGGTLSSTIDQLDLFHDDIKKRLESIMHHSEELEKSITHYLRHEERAKSA
ncbi:PAS domain-containing protein [Thioclava sp. A2]|uniref:PAS domain-containing protein n=1 Tax=Thioclava sp. FCG-A2 TaxID=3080562 RepID=UPI002954EBB4|nr:PAS domain-containing protein [Thioclava sp. A2]MDV7270489.1 PAS domain-containing protein [Thioclava sp. A2]